MKRWYLFSGILLALLGLLVIIFPAFWVKVVVILLGLGMIAYGIYNLKFTMPIFEDSGYKRAVLIKSIESIVIGAVAVIFPLAFGATMWKVMIWFQIISLLISAAIGFYAAALLKDSGVDRKNFFLENIFLVIAAVVLILISPDKLGIAIVRIIGIAVMVIGAAFIIVDLTSKKEEIVVVAEASDDVETGASDDEESTSGGASSESSSDSE